MSDTGLVPVKLLRNFANYNKDEVVGFHKDRAEAMVKGGVAEFYKTKQPPQSAQSSPKPQASKTVSQQAKNEQDTF